MWCVARVGVKVCYVVIFIGSVGCCTWKLLWLVYACEWDLWSRVGFDGSSVAVEIWVGCSVGCCVL